MRRLVLLTLGLLLAGGALAADPTRPPEAWLQPGAATAGSEGGLRLQSVLLPQRGRPLAIIGGQTVPLGGRYGDATLVRVSEREAVLQGPDGVVRLYLTPDVDKRMIVPAAGNKARTAAQGKETR
ncbi:MAG TPA: hypothetical protein VF096_12635 [Azonexus sp.]